jgi:lipoate-protein ligase B
VAEPRYGVTSLADLGRTVSMAQVDAVLRREFELLFGRTIDPRERDEIASQASALL